MAKQKKQEQEPQADNNSIAVGEISIGGDVSGIITIGHTNIYNAAEDDLPLSSDEIENGLTRFAQFLPERAPVLQDSFSSIAKKLRATLGADQNSLSPALKSQREEGVNRMKLMCMEVTDISFRAICLGQNPPPYDLRSPFLGLFAFRPEDREFFFGRDALVQKLVARIKAHPFLAVLGASGSGKSSLVMAGLVPVLEAQMSYLTPSSSPLSQLLAAKESTTVKTVFVIDQFEELFTHLHDAAECTDFIHALLDLTKTNRVVITMRADFWGEVAIYSDLKQAMQEHQELIAPMTMDELHSAMEKQAAVVGLRFDPTLSESILAEVKGEPGAMPLLQHALWELWNRRHGLWIKAEEYQAFGGVKQAIASTAEEVYASCSDFERDRVRDIFLRLTRLDESGEGRDTRRRVLIEELIPVNSDSSVTINLLNKLADARLIVKTEADVEVAHEALIRHWSRLIEWLNEDRDNLRLREGVSESAREWENSKRDDSLLNHRGGRLELALAMSKLPRYQLNPVEQAYLNACVALKNKEQRDRERRMRWTVTASIAAAIIFLILGSFGLIKSNEATAQSGTAQANANTAATEKAKAEEQANVALARQLAAQAQSISATRNSKQLIADLLAIQSMNIFPSSEAAQILLNNNFEVRPTFLLHHRSVVFSVAISSDGKYAVSGSANDVRVWDVSTGKEVATMTHDGTVYSVAFSPDGKYVASGSIDNTARVWEVATGREISRMYYAGWVLCVGFSPDSKYLVSGSRDNTAGVLEIATGKYVSLIHHDNWVKSVAFSPDGRYVVSGSQDATARVWEAATGREKVRFTDNGFINSVIFSPDGKYIATGGWDTSRVWEVATGKEIARTTFASLVNSVAFSPNGKYVVSGSVDSTARIWEAATGKEISRITHDGSVNSVAFSSDGIYVVSGSYDGTARVWEAETGQEVARMTHDDIVNIAIFSPDGKNVISGSYDNSVRIWKAVTTIKKVSLTANGRLLMNYAIFTSDGKYVMDPGRHATPDIVLEAATGNEVANFDFDGVISSSAFSPDGKYVISGSDDKTARIWEIATGKEISRMTHEDIVSSIAFSPDGKLAVSGSDDHTARVWVTDTGKEVARMTHDGPVHSVIFSPDGTYVASISDDRTSRVWEAATGKEIARMTHDGQMYAVAFSPDGKYVVSGSYDKTARVWDTATGKEIARMTHDAIVYSVEFSPDGKHVASGSTDNTVRVWETATGKEIARVVMHYTFLPLAFSPDGRYVLSGDRIWGWQANDLIADACQVMPRNLTRAEWDQYIGDALPYQAVCPNLPIEAE